MPTGPLQPSLPIWGLLGRILLYALGLVFIIPSPWTTTMLYDFLCRHVVLANGKRFKFTGQPADIWPVLVGVAVLFWLQQIHQTWATVIGMLGSWVLMVLVIRWFCSKLTTEDDSMKLSFVGEIAAYVGWNILLIVSFVTIIGWAWVAKAMVQWMCRNVTGNVRFEFNATGLEILWRSFAFALLGIFIVPIPWLMRWWVNWFISQFSASEAA